MTGLLNKVLPSRRTIGQRAERIAEKYLKQYQLKTLQKNYHSRFGEIDIIMHDQDSIVFIEVRCRNNTNYGSGAETVTASKQQKIIKTAQVYLQQHPEYKNTPARFDVVSICNNKSENKADIDWIKNAFC